MTGCQSPPGPPPEGGVAWELAEQRQRSISDLRYEIQLTIPESHLEPILGLANIRFQLSDPSLPLVIDFEPAADRTRAVRVDGQPVEYRTPNGHIVVAAADLRQGENSLRVEFQAGDTSLNRNPEYLYTLFVPDRASFAIPCFDQPNLKGRWTLTLQTPPAWQAVSNGPLIGQDISEAGATFRFGETKPISTYLFSFAAGKFQVEAAERGGRPMRMLHRETDAAKVERNREAIFDLHRKALQWLEEYSGIPYPFQKFDFVLIPSFQYGGMEHPGAIQYNAARLLLEESATQNEYLGRAGLIAHETAHMWFGDLVTMNWFDDVWTKEVFANFMAAKIVNPSFPDLNHELRFLLAHYPTAYGVDRTAGANPIRQPLENLKMAGTLYGAIIYQKAPIVMKHLERLVGKQTFRQGLQEYLKQFQYANATWPDLIEILDRLSDQELKSWSRVWVEEPGRPTVRTELSLEGPNIAGLSLHQSDPQGRGLLWTQQLDVLLGHLEGLERIPVQLEDASVDVEEASGKPAPDFILVNGSGVGYGYFELDAASRDYLMARLPQITDPLVRGIAWVSLWEALLEGQVSSAQLLELALAALGAEEDELNLQRILRYAQRAYWRFLDGPDRQQMAHRLEALYRSEIAKRSSSTIQAAYFNAFRSIVMTEAGVKYLRAVWEEKEKIEGLSFSERDYTAMAAQLALRGIPDAEAVLDAQAGRIQNPDRQSRFAFVRPALSADQSVRDAFFASLSEESNRQHEPWVLEALRYLHHPLRASHSEKYIRPALELLEEIQRSGDIFFPKRWLDATLGGHSSSHATRTVGEFLDRNPDLSSRLRAKLQQSAHELFRAAEFADSRQGR